MTTTKSRHLAVALLLFAWLGCGGKTDGPVGSGSSPSPGADASADAKAARVPKKHRAAGTDCPKDRGPGSLRSSPSCPTDGGLTDCSKDTECASGAAGRCISGHFACSSFCSYDTCGSDSDCSGNAPCECRASGTDLATNSCQTTSNCRVDSDCGPGGYCSPSQVNVLCFCLSSLLCDKDSGYCCIGTDCSPDYCACGDACGHGYYCHTPSDQCVDDSDCATGDSCNYDTVIKRWTCGYCLPPP